MYTGQGFNKWGIGDVDVIRADGLYHLFHLVLPNHAYIAHATSPDGLHWSRAKHALFISDPPKWDDGMLWTMHVSPDPDKKGAWRMFYSGLTRSEKGRIQRIGLALSDDLYNWQKVEGNGYPIEIKGELYESSLDQGRHWVSFRDPFFTEIGKERWLLAAARVPFGPIHRRGCVFLAREIGRDKFEIQKPLSHPGLYDDIEVPALVELAGRYYLIGSIREDIKVHYWYSDSPRGPFSNFSDNVLLPKGNYAARICPEDDRLTVWNFFYQQGEIKGMNNLLPPPKELVTTDSGELKLKSFSGFDQQVAEKVDMNEITPLTPLSKGSEAMTQVKSRLCRMGSSSGFEMFLFKGCYQSFRLRCNIEMFQNGKCGIVFRVDEEGNGYYISLELVKGLVQLRAWSMGDYERDIEAAFRYDQLQAAYYVTDNKPAAAIELVVYGEYLELSIAGYVLISLADDSFETGRLGFYTEGAIINVDNLSLEVLEGPRIEM
jgi:beta-fructofuranosidase